MIVNIIIKLDYVKICNLEGLAAPLGVPSKKHSIFKDIIQIEVDPSPSHPIFDKFIFDTVITSLPPLEFLTKTQLEKRLQS